MIIRGTAKWPHVFEKSKMSGKYEINICNLDKTALQYFKSESVPVKKGEGDKAHMGHFVVAKSEKYAPVVKDHKGDLMDGTVLIGNGSKIKVSTDPYDWVYQGKAGRSAGLSGLMVTSLVPYNGGGDELVPEEGDDIGEESDEL